MIHWARKNDWYSGYDDSNALVGCVWRTIAGHWITSVAMSQESNKFETAEQAMRLIEEMHEAVKVVEAELRLGGYRG